MEGKNRGEIRSESGMVIGMTVVMPTTNSLRKKNGAFGGQMMAAGKVGYS